MEVENDEEVTNVELEVFKREITRRGEEFTKSNTLQEVLDEAQDKSEHLLQVLDSKWENLSTTKNPYDLAKVTSNLQIHIKALLKQREDCEQIVAMKDKLINNYMGELKLKDDEYIKEFKRQSDETGTPTLHNTNSQINSCQKWKPNTNHSNQF